MSTYNSEKARGRDGFGVFSNFNFDDANVTRMVIPPSSIVTTESSDGDRNSFD
jgi:hypothetical protein